MAERNRGSITLSPFLLFSSHVFFQSTPLAGRLYRFFNPLPLRGDHAWARVEVHVARKVSIHSPCGKTIQRWRVLGLSDPCFNPFPSRGDHSEMGRTGCAEKNIQFQSTPLAGRPLFLREVINGIYQLFQSTPLGGETIHAVPGVHHQHSGFNPLPLRGDHYDVWHRNGFF